ncbi:flagellar hook-length control protein FliK [Paenibacillus agricola]|uniref:Flagellar hook-length control protein-like C-terminal domain-containing protein n=1 Tax=Paenibacillus agricola TaxID=2716264 RepID=A0ABX0J3H2_9BACL|nr:flagellar hook-length control protein FliK [Paenibacillus agricola]NHN28380.1 hypothetical protein [Paenibacillus agricola]
MEIQAQITMPTNTTNGSNLNAAVANGAASTSSSTSMTASPEADFSATLNGLITMAPAAVAPVNSQAGLSGLNNILVQLLTTLKMDSAASEGQSNEDSIKQLDLLINMLNTDTEEAEDILDNPNVQTWLAGIQTMLMVHAPTPEVITTDEELTAQLLLTDSASTGDVQLNPLLFVPIQSTTNNGAATEHGLEDAKELITKTDAFKLLDTFKQLLKADDTKIVLPQAHKAMQVMVDQMQQLIATVVQDSTKVTADPIISAELVSPLIADKSVSRVASIVTPMSNRPAASKGMNDDASFQVVATANARLEYLAANFVQAKLTVDTGDTDRPLFEPLQEMPKDSSDEGQAIPMHEFLKQVQSSQPMQKAPVIMMQAPNFVEDMTQFVIKSFTLETKADGFTEAKLSLFPQNLGQVDVRLTMHNGQLVAQFMADSPMGREMLESQLSQLKITLQNQGIQVERMEVSQNQAFQSGMFQEQRQQQSQQSNKQQKGNDIDKVLSLDDQVNQEIVQSVDAPKGLGKTSIDTTA